jgi:FkbM family methyltransferase
MAAVLTAACKLVALPWARLELPQWRRVLNRAIGHHRIEGAPLRTIRGKLHGFTMELDTADWSERWTYYLGRYYETHTQLLLRAALRPGDTFIDVGANIGMTVLVAAALVAPRQNAGSPGRVVAFEPNPHVFARLRRHVELNGLQRVVETRQEALGERAETLTLSVPGRHTGMATLGRVRDEHKADVSATYTVPVAVAHLALAPALLGQGAAPALIKIDVEGFECSVLRGLAPLLDPSRGPARPALVTEAVEVLLAHAGASLADLFGLMRGFGYLPFSVEHTTGIIGALNRPRLRRLAAPTPNASDDVLWLPELGRSNTPSGEHARRLARWFVG